MKIKSQKDFAAGAMFSAAGVAFAWGATTYTIGEGARMGPGYFPLMLGVVLSLLGAAIMFQALVVETEDGEPIGRWAWKPLGLHPGGQPAVWRAAGRAAQRGRAGHGADHRHLRPDPRGQPGR
jgi:hypothetical protein